MLDSLLILVRYSVIFFFLLPLAVHFGKKTKSDNLQTIVIAVGLSLGLGSYFLFLAYLINGLVVNQSTSFAFFLLIFFILFFLFRQETLVFVKEIAKQIKRFFQRVSLGKLMKFFFNGPIGLIRLLITILCVYVVLLGPFFPISQWDDLVRYAAWGNQIFTRGEIGNHINSYPLLVPLLYTYGFLSSGFRNDYIIKFIPLAFGFLTLALVYLTANEFFDNRKYRGLLAVFFTLCFVPFIDWFHLGYVDIAAAFYLSGTLYFFYKYAKTGKESHLIVFGLFLGLSLWTKQQTMMVFLSVFLASLLVFISKRVAILDNDLRVSLRKVFLGVLVSLPIFLPWYIRDFVLVGTPLQIPVFDSKPTLESFFLPFIVNIDSVGYYPGAFFQVAAFLSLGYLFVSSRSGIVFTQKHLRVISVLLISSIFLPRILQSLPKISLILNTYLPMLAFAGIFLGIYSFYFSKKYTFRLKTNLVLLLLWIFPFYFVWWFNYAMVFRYLITIVPLFAILFIFSIDQIFPKIKGKLPLGGLATILVVLLLVAFVSPRLSDVLHAKGLTYFFSDSDTKGLKTVDDSFVVGKYLNSIPVYGQVRIISNDNRFSYYAPKIDFYNNTPAYLSDLVSFDYFVLNPWTKEAYDLRKKDYQEVYFNLTNENPKVFEKVYEHTPYKVYKIIVSRNDFKSEEQKVKETQLSVKINKSNKINNIGAVFIPKVTPGTFQYKVNSLKDRQTLFLDKLFYNRPKDISVVASKQLLETLEICINQNNCDLARSPLLRFRDLITVLKKQSQSPDRLLVDENFYTFQSVEKMFDEWAIVLTQISEKSSSVSSLASEILTEDFYPFVGEYEHDIERLEPRFDYFNSSGSLVKVVKNEK